LDSGNSHHRFDRRCVCERSRDIRGGPRAWSGVKGSGGRQHRVQKGDLLLELDREPYEVAVGVQKAAVDTAKADLEAAKAMVRGIEAKARSQRWKLQHAMEDVANQIALLHAKVAALDKSKASLKLAEAEFERAKQLVAKAYTSREEYDRREAALSVARAEVIQALDDIHQIRVSLGLPAEPENGGDLGQVPPDLDRTFSSVRQAQSELIQSAAELGVVHSYNQTPKQMLEQFEKLDPQGNIDQTFARLVPGAPAVKQGEAKLESAERDLDQAELNLRYCQIIAEIDGVVTRRNVNPGNNVLAGQGLMAIRSLREIWVDANFKETQLRDLRIGQAADLYVDMYGGRRVFPGRIAGFTMGTGSTLALLPPQNATGNFLKWYNACRCALSFKTTTQTRILCSSAFRLSPKLIRYAIDFFEVNSHHKLSLDEQ